MHTLESVRAVYLPLSAVGCVDLTVDAAESCGAAAGVAVDTIGAVPSVTTGGAHALVYVLRATLAAKTRQTHAHKTVHAVLTDSTITAGICERERNVSMFSVGVVVFVYFIFSMLLTWCTIVDIGLAQISRESRVTVTLEAATQVLAHSSVGTRVPHTLIDVHLTCLTCRDDGG